MMNELRAAREALSGLCGAATSVLCAVSGGLDSMCLLHLLSTWGQERNMAVTAAHFNHRLRGAESDRDEAFVRDWCAGHAVPFVSGCADVRALAAEAGLCIEEAARNARYAFLEEKRRELGCAFVLTAHHADDNAETMLLNLLRGTGLRGLTGIPERRERIVRPFLSVTRAELAAYAAECDLAYVEDSTNALDDAARNVLRHKVLPVLKELNPCAVENMARTAKLLERDERALEEEAGRLLRAAAVKPGIEAALPLDACREREQAVVSRAVWSLLCSVGGHRKDLTAGHVEAACDLLRGEIGREVSLPYGMTAQREEAALVIYKKEPPPEGAVVQTGGTVSFGGWTVTLAETEPGQALCVPEGAQLTVTAWDRSDRMTLPGSRGERSLKRLCADRQIPSARRDTMPVLRVDGRIAAAPGIGVDVEFMPRSHEPVFVRFHQNIEEKR